MNKTFVITFLVAIGIIGLTRLGVSRYYYQECNSIPVRDTTSKLVPDRYIVALHKKAFTHITDSKKREKRIRAIAKELIKKAQKVTSESGFEPSLEVHGDCISKTKFDMVDKVFGLGGFSARLSPPAVQSLRNNPDVKNIEPDYWVDLY